MAIDEGWQQHSSDYSLGELIIGYSQRRHLLIISLAERDDMIRIISARKADTDERNDYEQAQS